MRKSLFVLTLCLLTGTAWARPKTIPQPYAELGQVEFSPDSKMLVVQRTRSSADLVEVNTGVILARVAVAGRLVSFSCSPDNGSVAGLDDEATVHLWDRSGRQFSSCQFPSLKSEAAAFQEQLIFTPYGLLIQRGLKTIFQVDPETSNMGELIQGVDLAVSAQRGFITDSGLDKFTPVYSSSNGRMVAKIPGRSWGGSKDGQVMTYRLEGTGPTIRIFDCVNHVLRAPQKIPVSHPNPLNGGILQGDFVYYQENLPGQGRVLECFNLRQKKLQWTRTLGSSSGKVEVAVSSDGRLFFHDSRESRVTIVAAATGKVISTGLVDKNRPARSSNHSSRMILSPDSTSLAFLVRDAMTTRVLLVNPTTLRVEHELNALQWR